MHVLMPQLGETVAEGRITTWFKAVGDPVAPGDTLFEIETDKVSMEVPATEAGVLSEIRVKAGETVPVGAVVAVIAGQETEAAAAPVAAAMARSQSPAAGTAQPLAAPAAPADPEGARRRDFAYARIEPFFEVRTPERNYGPARLPGGIAVTPLARRLAAENGIDLSRIAGSGPHGRILARDVTQALRAAETSPTPPPAPPAPSAGAIKALYAGVPHAVVPLDAMRRTIARRLSEAARTIPQFHLSLEVRLDALAALRAEANAAAPQAPDGTAAYHLTLTDFAIKALALALQQVPAANAVWAEDSILRLHHSDIAVAVALDGGLLTPVIREAERKPLSAIARERKELVVRARARRLAPEALAGGATTISNLGMHGIGAFTALINPPQATILALGAAARRPYETADGGIGFATQLTATLGCDHRVVDGALGAALLAAFKDLLEHPVRMLV